MVAPLAAGAYNVIFQLWILRRCCWSTDICPDAWDVPMAKLEARNQKLETRNLQMEDQNDKRARLI